MIERQRGFLAALARVLGEALGQRLQAGVGAFGEQVQALAEAVDALALLLRHAADLLAEVAAATAEALLQFLAAGALFLAHRALDARAVVLQPIQLGYHARVAATPPQAPQGPERRPGGTAWLIK